MVSTDTNPGVLFDVGSLCTFSSFIIRLPQSSLIPNFLSVQNSYHFTLFKMAPAIVSDIELPAEVPESRITPASKASTFKLFSLEDKTVAITGGARGLGITLAIAVVEAGGSVACLDILEEPSAAEWAQLNKVAMANGSSVSYRKCDVTDETSMDTVIKEIVTEAENSGSPFWGAIACAGIQQQIPALDYPAADFDRMLRVNVTGVFNTCKYTARALKENKAPGSIVIISSMSGNVANRVRTPATMNGHLLTSLDRDFRVQHTIRARLPCSKCVDRLLKNGAHMVFESTRCRPA